MKETIQRFKTLFIWILLFFVAIFILLIFGPPCFIIGLIAKFWRKKVGTGLDEFTKDLENTTITLDILGNVTLFNWVWFLFKTKDGYKFGNRKETVSHVLKRNHDSDTLKYLGKPLYNIINFFDPGHFDEL